MPLFTIQQVSSTYPFQRRGFAGAVTSTLGSVVGYQCALYHTVHSVHNDKGNEGVLVIRCNVVKMLLSEIVKILSNHKLH